MWPGVWQVEAAEVGLLAVDVGVVVVVESLQPQKSPGLVHEVVIVGRVDVVVGVNGIVVVEVIVVVMVSGTSILACAAVVIDKLLTADATSKPPVCGTGLRSDGRS